MHKLLIFIISAITVLYSSETVAQNSAQTSFGQSSLFNDGWIFVQQDAEGAELPVFDDSKWMSVSVPHDWSVKGPLSPSNAACTGFLPAGIGWYRKHFSGRSLTSDKVYIYFEGVYNRSSVYLNGHLLGTRPSGYNSFMYDLTPYLDRKGDNVIAVRVDHSRIADSRWYPGSGIYRDVWLVQSGATHFSLWGLGYSAASISDKQAIINVETSVENLPSASSKFTLDLAIRDTEGKLVAKTSTKADAKQVTTIKLKTPHRWDINDPYLYTLEATLLNGKETVDFAQTSLGLRTLEFNADWGFKLNGRNTKVKGVCLHHDAGVLGTAVPDEVLERRLKTLKSLGVNAIRTSHNPQAPVFYDICDRIGLLVMDEAFDEWEFNKKKWVEGWNVGTPAFDGTADYFEEWSERDVKDMVLRDRNHPSIFLWSIGNEVDYPNDPYSHPILDGGNFEFNQPMSGGYKPDAPDAMRIGVIAKRFTEYIHSIDTSRPVTGALAGVVMSNQTEYPQAVDVVGYNYTESRYEKDHSTYPERIIYGSENRHGFADWKAVRDNGHIFGQFLWTGADYLGEAGVWPARGSGAGLIDLGNFVKPRGRFRAALWSETPVCYIGTYLKPQVSTGRRGGFQIPDSPEAWDSWNYEDDQTVRVVCYTNAASARLMLNGKEVGARTPHNDETGIIGWDVPFTSGTLKAEGFDESGAKVSEYEIKTSGRPFSLKATADKLDLDAGGSVAQIVVEVLDEAGIPVKLADNAITCIVEGGELLGLESGDMSDTGVWTDNVQRVFKGRLVAYVKSGMNPGTIKVRFTSPLLKSAELTLSTHSI